MTMCPEKESQEKEKKEQDNATKGTRRRPTYTSLKQQKRELDTRTEEALEALDGAVSKLDTNEIHLAVRLQEYLAAVAAAAGSKAQLAEQLATCTSLIVELLPGVEKAKEARCKVKADGKIVEERIAVLQAAIAAASAPASQAERYVVQLTTLVESLEAQVSAANEVAERERVGAAESDKALADQAARLQRAADVQLLEMRNHHSAIVDEILRQAEEAVDVEKRKTAEAEEKAERLRAEKEYMAEGLTAANNATSMSLEARAYDCAAAEKSIQACARQAEELRGKVSALEAELAAARDAITQERAAAAAAATAAAQAQVESDAALRVAQSRCGIERQRLEDMTKDVNQFRSSMKSANWLLNAKNAELSAKLKETEERADSRVVEQQATAAAAMERMAAEHDKKLETAVAKAVTEKQKQMQAEIEKAVAAKSKEAGATLEELKRSSAEKACDEVRQVTAAAAKAVADARAMADKRIADVTKSKDKTIAAMASAAKQAMERAAHAQATEQAACSKLVASHALEVATLKAENERLRIELSKQNKEHEENVAALKSDIASRTAVTAAAPQQTTGGSGAALKVSMQKPSESVKAFAQQPSAEKRESRVSVDKTPMQPSAKAIKAVAEQPILKKAASMLAKVVKTTAWKNPGQLATPQAFCLEEFPSLTGCKNTLANGDKDTSGWSVPKTRRNQSLPREAMVSKSDMTLGAVSGLELNMNLVGSARL